MGLLGGVARISGLIIAISMASSVSFAQKTVLAKELVAGRTAFFEDKTGAPAVGKKAVEELKRWGRWKIVEKREAADLLVVLSRQPVKIAMAQSVERTSPRYGEQGQVKSAYLTVIDLGTNEVVWGDRHVWGGVLTGENSAGEKLVKELEKEMATFK